MDREPDDELFGDDIGLIGWVFCWTPAPGCEDTLFGGNDCWDCCCWLFVAALEAFSDEFCAATAAAAAAAASAWKLTTEM